jgi:hypothetical protein
MPTIFEQLEDTADRIKKVLSQYEAVDEGHEFSWPNFVFRSSTFRRAHLDIVDARDTKKLFMMHLCVFPHINDPSPIYGFDIIAGPSKVTGAFHDFSPVAKEHPLLSWFATKVSEYEWSKERQLPEWARNIFSGNMVAAGNISDVQELESVLSLAVANLEHYLSNVGISGDIDYTKQHNWYCQNQKQNPHTPRVMTALGLDTDEVNRFIDVCLFPEVT